MPTLIFEGQANKRLHGSKKEVSCTVRFRPIAKSPKTARIDSSSKPLWSLMLNHTLSESLLSPLPLYDLTAFSAFPATSFSSPSKTLPSFAACPSAFFRLC